MFVSCICLQWLLLFAVHALHFLVCPSEQMVHQLLSPRSRRHRWHHRRRHQQPPPPAAAAAAAAGSAAPASGTIASNSIIISSSSSSFFFLPLHHPRDRAGGCQAYLQVLPLELTHTPDPFFSNTAPTQHEQDPSRGYVKPACNVLHLPSPHQQRLQLLEVPPQLLIVPKTGPATTTSRINSHNVRQLNRS